MYDLFIKQTRCKNNEKVYMYQLTGRHVPSATENMKFPKLVNAVPLPAQSVDFAFAIVKATRRESLGIIKKTEICSLKISMKSEKIISFEHFVKTIKEQIFTSLLIIFTAI